MTQLARKSKLSVDSINFKYAIIATSVISAVTVVVFCFGSQNPLDSTFDLLEIFRQETTLATKNKDGIFEMRIPAIQETRKREKKLLFYLSAAFIAIPVTGILTIVMDYKATRSQNEELHFSLWKLIVLSSVVGNLAVHGTSFFVAKQSIDYTTSEDLRKEIVDLLEFATDKHPAGLTLIEQAQGCCRVVSKTNRTLSGATPCNPKMITCSDAVLNVIKWSTKISIYVMIAIFVVFAVYFCFLGSSVMMAVSFLRHSSGDNQIQFSAINNEQDEPVEL